VDTYISHRVLETIGEPSSTIVPLFTELFSMGSISVKCDLVTDRLCFLVVRVPGYRSRGPGSIPGATRFSEK
jgi:hypothetical protein